jgi:hypothetical protein
MNDSTLTCQNELRRQKVRKHSLNGFDYLEVKLFERDGRPKPRPTLRVYFLGKAPHQKIEPQNVRIEGGRRIPGREIHAIEVDIQRNDDPELDDSLLVTLNRSGDFSAYTFRLAEVDKFGRPSDSPFPGFDPRYSSLQFNFNADCPSDLDCQTELSCPPKKREQPDINYLGKDYATFRQLILDRLSLVMPDWRERHVPDLLIALVEVLAYTGDYLSYYQDAVSTEAYLDTARQRISVRRHVRLVDYPMHEGCNARAWVSIDTDSDISLIPEDLFFITGQNDVLGLGSNILTAEEFRSVPSGSYEVFEPLVAKPNDPIKLYEAHSEIYFYTWDDKECCLPQGATSATLEDAWLIPEDSNSKQGQHDYQYEPKEEIHRREQEPTKNANQPQSQKRPRKLHLQPGDIIIFEEVIGPKTGDRDDADPSHRHAVRLTAVTPDEDKLADPAVPIVQIEWAEEDALPFSLCISTIGPGPKCELLQNISVARGNVVEVDNGLRLDDEPLGMVESEQTRIFCEREGQPSETFVIPRRFRPTLDNKSLTFSQALRPNDPASRRLTQDPRQAVPQISLKAFPGIRFDEDEYTALFQSGDLKDPTRLIAVLRAAQSPRARYLRGLLSSRMLKLLPAPDESAPAPPNLVQQLVAELSELVVEWTPQRDLLSSTALEQHFVVELDNEGVAHLRFGDGELGKMPTAGTDFSATYRVGNGISGNVGAEAITHIVFRETTLSGVALRPRNPLPAQGGIDPELLAEVKLFAPHAFRDTIERAITADDYAQITEREFSGKVQRSRASLRWTGSWYQARVAVDPFGTDEADRSLLNAIAGGLYPYRRMGHDLVVEPADYVPLVVELAVCVKSHYLRGHVHAALLKLLSNRMLFDGRLGFFHPDNLSFGDGVYLSKLVAAVQSVEGVEGVDVNVLRRQFELPNREIENGILPLDTAEIAQLDNDPSFPERGILTLAMRGGR